MTNRNATLPTRKPPGLRFSATDGVVIALVAVATPLLLSVLGPFAFLFPIVLAHFFLFCNVFRVRRNYELIWAVTFVLNVAAWAAFGPSFRWAAVLFTQTPFTLATIAAEMLGGHYHGIFYQRINPDHPPSRPD